MGETFGNQSLIVRPDTQQYEMLQGSIVAIGTKVCADDEVPEFVVGDVVTFNKYHVSSFEVEMAPGEMLVMDDIHSTDIRWSWPE